MQEAARRKYDATRRQEQARAQRRRILEAARRRFLDEGYAATVGAIAAESGVSVETVYKAFRNKAGLLRAVFDFSVAGDDEPQPMIERDFAERMRAEPNPRTKIEIFAEHMAESMPRAGPVYLLARAAAASEPEIARVLEGWRAGQLDGLGRLAAHLAETGLLRDGVSTGKARDLLWTINSTEVYELLVVERGWTAEEYRDFLAKSMIDALL